MIAISTSCFRQNLAAAITTGLVIMNSQAFADSRRGPTRAAGPACTATNIAAAARQAPQDFQSNSQSKKIGWLYGHDVWESTESKGQPGYLACAAVTSSILRKAGCSCIDFNLDVAKVYKKAISKGWEEVPTESYQEGDLLIWNTLPLITGIAKKMGYATYPAVGSMYKNQEVVYRHIGIATSTTEEVDNTPVKGPESKIIGSVRGIKYRAPVVLRLKKARGCR